MCARMHTALNPTHLLRDEAKLGEEVEDLGQGVAHPGVSRQQLELGVPQEVPPPEKKSTRRQRKKKKNPSRSRRHQHQPRHVSDKKTKHEKFEERAGKKSRRLYLQSLADGGVLRNNLQPG